MKKTILFADTKIYNYFLLYHYTYMYCNYEAQCFKNYNFPEIKIFIVIIF